MYFLYKLLIVIISAIVIAICEYKCLTCDEDSKKIKDKKDKNNNNEKK